MQAIATGLLAAPEHDPVSDIASSEWPDPCLRSVGRVLSAPRAAPPFFIACRACRFQKALHPLRPVRRSLLRRPGAPPGHQQGQREPVVAVVLQRRVRRATLWAPATGVTPACAGPDAAARPARSRDIRGTPAAARDGSSSSPPRGRGRAGPARSRPPTARGRCVPPRSSRPACSIAASAAAKRARKALRRSPGSASTTCSSRSPSVRDTGTSWRQQAPQPLRQEIRPAAALRSAASTTAFTSPCRAGTTSAAGTGAGRHGDRMDDPERPHGEAQSGPVEWPESAMNGVSSRCGRARRRTLQGAHAKRQRHPPHLPRVLPHATATRSWPRARSCRATTRR